MCVCVCVCASHQKIKNVNIVVDFELFAYGRHCTIIELQHHLHRLFELVCLELRVAAHTYTQVRPHTHTYTHTYIHTYAGDCTGVNE